MGVIHPDQGIELDNLGEVQEDRNLVEQNEPGGIPDGNGVSPQGKET